MPRSRHRHKHHYHHAEAVHPARPTRAARRSPVVIMIVFTALLGCMVALISAGTDPLWLFTGIIIGGIVGYFIGRSMDKVARKEK
jgi:membrane protein YqaA with SNARE-associated domain